jgi:hypothetical protein
MAMVGTPGQYGNQRLARVADLPTSRQAMLGMYRPHAVATTQSTTCTVAAATRGLVAMRNPAQPGGVLAPEISRGENHSRIVITYASLLVVVATFILQIGMATGFALSPWL